MLEYSVEGFKELFNRGEFPFLPVYDEEKTYMNLDEVYDVETERFYTSKADYNKGNPLTDENYWAETSDKVENFIQDKDIERAFREAYANFNERIFEDEILELVFYYLTAHYLYVDTRNSSTGGAVNIGIMSSKAVGNVSAGYMIPKRYLNSPLVTYYAQNGFGQKYLSYLLPRMTAMCMVVGGRSLP